jgi:glycosyltransferase involved in cell wall biosynthesis
MKKLYIVIPAYNEDENIETCINDWYPIVEKHNGNGESRLVIINDGSKDSTYEVMQKLAETRPLFIPLTKPNGGHGSTVL